MSQLLTWLGWGLIAVAGIVIAYPFVVPLVKFDLLINALPAGVLVALGAQLLTQGKSLGDIREKRSLFFLESCVKAYEEARKLLEDGNSERIKWIAAGRALAHAKELASNVSEDPHRRVLELHKLKYRGFFHGALADKPAAFFFGVKDTSVPTDDAAELSTAREERGGCTVTSTLHELSDKSLREVWGAAQWPEDYQDPVNCVFSAEERAELALSFPGLHEFLEHKERWVSASGKLHPKK